MTKSRTSIFIIGMLVVVIAASLLTVFALFMTGTIVTDRIALVYEVRNEDKEYDGTPLCAEYAELVSGELQKNHHAEIGFLGEQTDVGASESSVSVRIFDEEGYDVTDEYKISVKSGTLNVYKRKIFVTLTDEDVEYNGSKVEFEDYEAEYTGENKDEDPLALITGHRVIGKQNTTLINVGKLPSDIDVAVVDAAGKEVTNNYDIEIDDMTDEEGKYIGPEVVPRKIKVKPADIEKVYDGIEIRPSDVEILSGSLVEGQEFGGQNYGEAVIISDDDGNMNFIDACDEPKITRINTIKIYQPPKTEEGGEWIDVTENYEFVDNYDSETGFIKIDPRPLTITAPNVSWVYDDEVHDPNNEKELPAPEYEGFVADDEESIKGAPVKYTATIKYVGSTPNTIDEDEFKFPEKGNYDIEFIPGTLEITPRIEKVTLKNVSKTYNAEVQTISLDDAVEINDGNKFITTEKMADYLEITTEPNAILKDADTYTYGVKLRDKYNDGNIELNITGEGKYEIAKCTAKFSEDTIGAQKRPYDGKAFTFDAGKTLELQQSGKAIPFVTRFSLTYTTMDSTVGTYNEENGNLYATLRVYGKNDEDITSNFNITPPTIESLEIEQRKITFTLSNYFYSGSRPPDELSESVLLGCLGVADMTPLPYGFFLRVDVVDVSDLYDYSSRTISIDVASIRILDADGKDVTSNFYVTNLHDEYGDGAGTLTSYVIKGA